LHFNDNQIFIKYFPAASVEYCHQLWVKYRIQFTISRPRKSVYGNYVCRGGVHSISVNGDLNPEAFLVTYLHEVAHLLVHVSNKKRVLPHGKEWQTHFREVMKPMLEANIFEEKTARKLWQHLQSAKATSCSDPELHKLLMKHEESPDSEGVAVSELNPGQLFIYDARTFKVLRKLRTRTECIEINRSAVYRFSPLTRVRVLDEHSDKSETNELTFPISHLPIGTQFKFRQRIFLLREKRRTRFLCEDLVEKKLFLINQMVLVEPIK